ncbi:ElyC/SanA/YdcF family protein [uncultured Fibrobacter sp.]|uniref:ElyC/SanA/YdcF family protein n=1 Tax=uncultured Fibrobacter sp. TaxID=261512 RepID=UPI002601B192|nr:ElyC/SanA/YdcF family protein [uncultured Fibrobacter sp.]
MSKLLLNKKKKNYAQLVKKALIIAASTIILAIIALYAVFTKSGQWLVNDDEFKHVKWVVILDGQSADMERNDFAANLVAQGKADSVLIMGRRVLRDRSNADFYADDFLRHSSIDSAALFLAPHDDPSTISEAYTIIPWLKNRKADTVLLLTSAAATHRVANLFKALAGERPVFLTTDIHHYLYDANTWYINRESRKSWLREWAALLYSKFELIGLDTLTAADSTYYVPIRSVSEEKNMEPVVDLQKFLKQANSKTQEVINNAAKDTTKAVETAKKDSSKSESKAEPKKDDKKDVKKEESKKQEPKKDEKKETKKDEPKKEEKKDSKKEEPKKDDKKDNKSSSDKKKDEKKS